MARSVDFYKELGGEIHVLLAVHNADSLFYLKELLELYSYKVTAVKSGLAALQLISKKKKKIDLFLADVDLPDINEFSLLDEAIKHDLPTILMLQEGDLATAMAALENGVCFTAEKPISARWVGNMYKYVLKERILKGELQNQARVDETNPRETNHMPSSEWIMVPWKPQAAELNQKIQ